MITDNSTTPYKLWKDYYNCLKPHCENCSAKGIKSDRYAFCSSAKKPMPIYEEDAWGRRKKLLTIFNDIYECNVYHWTIYQGKHYLLKNKSVH